MEQRIYVHGTRWRVPDVCAMRDDHKKEEVFTQPPLIAIEVLSRKDEMGDVLDTCDDYHKMGVANIAVADPDRKRLFLVNDNARLVESPSLVVEFLLRPGKPSLSIDFTDLFQKLDSKPA